MSDSEFEPSSASEVEDSGSEYVASEQEEEPSRAQQRRPAARGPTRGAGGPGLSAAFPPPSIAAPQPKRQRAGQQPKLTDLLQTASKQQLVTLLLELDGESDGGLAGRVAALLPPPDLRSIQAEIQGLERKVEKAFPYGERRAIQGCTNTCMFGGPQRGVGHRSALWCCAVSGSPCLSSAPLPAFSASARNATCCSQVWQQRDAYAYRRVGPALRVGAYASSA